MNLACGNALRKTLAELVELMAVSHHRGGPASARRAPAEMLRAMARDDTRARMEDLASADSCSCLSTCCQGAATDSHIGSRPVSAVQDSESELARKSPRSSEPE